jgi:hypothetical protein
MKTTFGAPDRSSFGEVLVDKAQDLCLRQPGTTSVLRLSRFKYTWHPPDALQPHLPPEFVLSLQCVMDSDGVRRFYPWNSFATFLALASTGGLAILCQRQSLTAHQRHSYRAMRLLFLHAHRMAEHFRHRFDSSRDLTVAPSGRSEPGEKDILPEDLGLDTQGQGQRWSVKELIERGEREARIAGLPRPTMAQRIHCGLIEAARLNPLGVVEEKVPGLVRSALFSLDPSDEPTPEVIEIVTERLLTALHPHLEEDSSAFAKWFLGPKNSLIHQLAKQKTSPGSALNEGDVRRALLHLGWQAYQYASNCVRAQMRTLQNALLEGLTDREQLLFEHMHLPQGYLGGLPMVLLAPRLGFIKELLWQLWEELPDKRLVPVLHRLLDDYASMVVRRRQADRLIKSGRPVRFVEAKYVPRTQSERFQEIAAEVRELEGIDCGCPRREWRAELIGRPGSDIRIMHYCTDCSYQKETILPRQKFIEIAQAIL